MMGFPMDLNLPPKPCKYKHCGVMFKPSSTRAEYHSGDCRQKANQEKFAEKRRKAKERAK